MTRLSPRERRLLGWVGVALALYLLLDFAVLPWWDTLGESRDAAAIQARRVRNYRRILQRQDRTRSELARLRRRTESLEQGLLDSAGDALAGSRDPGPGPRHRGRPGVDHSEQRPGAGGAARPPL